MRVLPVAALKTPPGDASPSKPPSSFTLLNTFLLCKDAANQWGTVVCADVQSQQSLREV